MNESPAAPIRSLCTIMLVLAAGLEVPALARTPKDLEARCKQLIAYFDRYGASRSQHSDGRQNHTRIGAEIDCQRGNYEKGIATMEALLRCKKFTVPPEIATGR